LQKENQMNTVKEPEQKKETAQEKAWRELFEKVCREEGASVVSAMVTGQGVARGTFVFDEKEFKVALRGDAADEETLRRGVRGFTQPKEHREPKRSKEPPT
jgi:hypothetical protein